MATTVMLDNDVAVEVERLAREEGIGADEVVNRLIRLALAKPQSQKPFVQQSADLGMKIDITAIGAVLELLDGL